RMHSSLHAPDRTSHTSVDRLPQRIGESGRVDALHDVRIGTGAERGGDYLVRLLRREHDNPYPREASPQELDAGEPVDARHQQVEENQIGLGLMDERKQLAARLGLPDDLELGFILECEADRLEHEGVVVGDDESERPHGFFSFPRGSPSSAAEGGARKVVRAEPDLHLSMDAPSLGTMLRVAQMDPKLQGLLDKRPEKG